MVVVRITFIRLGPVHTNPFSVRFRSYFSSTFTLLCSQIKTDILQQAFTLVLKNVHECLFWKKTLARLVVASVFKFLRFWCSHYRSVLLHFHSAQFLSAYSFSSVSWVDECERKAKNRAKHINKGRFCNTIASVALVHTSIQSY